jgi:iron complex transport system ATP-binding protein
LGVILEARDLAIGYPGRMVGRGLDVSLNEGEALALLGPNGGGKTTLLKTLLGLIPPLAGDIRLTGRPLGGLSVRERARLIAYVPQVHAGAFAFTVEDVVLMGRNAHGDLFSRPSARDRQVAAAAIERLGIAHLADRPYTMISGGAFNYPHLGSGFTSFAPRVMSVSRERPRQMTVFPGGGSRVRAR